MEIRPPDNFRNAAELSPRTASSDPRSGGLHGEPVVIDLRRCSFIQPAAVLWCVVYPMLARLEGWRAERRDPGIHRVWCRGEGTYDRRPNRWSGECLLLCDAIFTHPTASEGLVSSLGQVERREDRRHN